MKKLFDSIEFSVISGIIVGLLAIWLMYFSGFIFPSPFTEKGKAVYENMR
jgi:hypothetical protein